ncbi:NAD-glutamate dehydrogenase [Suttonella ornithocola]|uniref:NAD-specific glutamate dehydrogenase n=1 Tax=Suttonella ornithocola TaxID=279832 RepID=A0A380MYN9_9GAMM|nr:NAD-glutamate dehydrogenase [Suttonella ornithocola]SUO97680.1 NAD-specific glutamate dehydrogenase [Suttonella ornithocola]
MTLTDDRLQAVLKKLPSLETQTHDRLAAFAPLYFSHLAQDDAATLSDTALAGMLLTHFSLLARYSGKAPVIRVFNPDVESDGYGSDHTVIEIVVRNRPFLVDTLVMALDAAEVVMHRLLHTIVHLSRDNDGNIVAIDKVSESSDTHVSIMYCEIDRLENQAALEGIAEKLREKISLLDVVVGDWGAMADKLNVICQSLTDQELSYSEYALEEVRAFLEWMADGHFTFLGFREYRIQENAEGQREWHRVGGSGLGVLREKGQDKISASFANLPTDLQTRMMQPEVLRFSKADQVSPVHRPVYMDMLGIQKIDEKGLVVGEYRFLGLLTASAYQLTPDQIPLLRDKVSAVLARAALPTQGHADKKMRHILNQMPRDDLFQADVDTLYPMALGILQLQDRKRLRLFARTDSYRRFVSCLVYVPRDKFSTEMRVKMQKILMKAFGGKALEFNTRFSDAHHARIHVHIRTEPSSIQFPDLAEVEAQLTAAMREWKDDFATELSRAKGEVEANRLQRKYQQAYPAAYREMTSPAVAVVDTQRLEALSESQPLGLHLFQSSGERKDRLHLKLYGRQEAPTLTYILPKLEHFGVLVSAAHPFKIQPNANDALWMQQYDLALRDVQSIDMAVVRAQFENAFLRVCSGEIESDRLNELVLTSQLNADEVVILRALARYMIQARAPFSADYIHQTLVKNAKIAVALIQLFHARLNPKSLETEAEKYQTLIEDYLQEVASLDEDRILHWYLTLINAILRTNFYQRNEDGSRKNRLSFKFNSQAIPELPKPRPMVEIFVYSPKVEAVHLRGGKVARGGLRWSDRMEDFRTEVLGLVKAQMVKNAVIVPVGSKGGFVVKTPTASREAMMAEGIECYKTFIRGLLDITDNLVEGKVVPPKDTVRHDGDDPYLVVAADKGTASFSDIANAEAKAYGFWLGDAFASGGSVGYDHKGMGITARGAWESVKRHFRHLGKDIQKEDFTVIGIGDMSGDVFGNGMLLSKHIRLQAAFNHLHIFIDPSPDAESSYQERKRLFELPRSNWADYQSSLISKGGGVFSRADKSIVITPEMKAAFGIEAERLTPNELIQQLLKAPVELLWNGGIGTYIKHSEETHSEVGDRANDALRVNGNEVQAKVIGEGGNLGVTQRGRIEYAQNGGRIYTDAIDNSGGVNCSDHEVNIKILLNAVVEKGDMTEKQRNTLLAEMTDEVAKLVLRQNYLQPQAIETAAANPALISEHARIIRQLEREGRLDRAIEYLPDEETLRERRKNGQGLTNPELAVLLAYSKMWLYDQLLASQLPDNPYFSAELERYFPSMLSEKYTQQMREHRLHREIIATYLTNSLINRMGAAFVFRVAEDSGADICDIASAYAIAREVFDARDYWQMIAQLDNQVPAQAQITLGQTLRQLISKATYWFLRQLPKPIEVDTAIERFKSRVTTLCQQHPAIQTIDQTLIDNWQAQGIPADIAQAFATLTNAYAALDIALLTEKSDMDIQLVADQYVQLRELLKGEWFIEQMETLPAESYWERRAVNALQTTYHTTLSALTEKILSQQVSIAQWQKTHQDNLAHLYQSIEELDKENISLASLSVLLGEIAVLDAQ